MIKTKLWKFMVILLIIFPVISGAISQAWKIAADKSNLTFTATQNGSPVNGKFANFSGDINFYPDQLNKSDFNIIVDMNSVTSSYKELSNTLKTLDWFNVAAFPQAIFKSISFIKTGTKTFQMTGTLTIRNKKQPVTLTFTQEKYTPTEYIIKGHTTIKRTAFGVGQGEWADTKSIKDDVLVNFTITAKN